MSDEKTLKERINEFAQQQIDAGTARKVGETKDGGIILQSMSALRPADPTGYLLSRMTLPSLDAVKMRRFEYLPVDCSQAQPHSWYETENTVRFDRHHRSMLDEENDRFSNPPRLEPEPPYGGRYARGR